MTKDKGGHFMPIKIQKLMEKRQNILLKVIAQELMKENFHFH